MEHLRGTTTSSLTTHVLQLLLWTTLYVPALQACLWYCWLRWQCVTDCCCIVNSEFLLYTMRLSLRL